MTLAKLLTFLVVFHLACGFVQVSVNYFGGDDAMPGKSDWWHDMYKGTPVDSLTGGVDEQDQQPSFLSDPRSILIFLDRIGDLLNGLLLLNYGFMDEMYDSGHLVLRLIVVLTRVAFSLTWLAVGIAALKLIFESGVLNSKVGLFLVVGGGSVAAVVSAVGGVIS